MVNLFHMTSCLFGFHATEQLSGCYKLLLKTSCIKQNKAMRKFKIVPLSKEYATKIKKSMTDEFGNTVTTQIATGRGPCRVSLKPFETGKDKRLLISHSPFSINNAFNQPGPVFISAEDVEQYSDIYRFPPDIKNDKQHFHLTLVGYNEQQQMVHAEMVGDRDVDELIEEIFNQKKDVMYLHARSAEACCYICKIERIN
jgi:hypothetical protein